MSKIKLEIFENDCQLISCERGYGEGLTLEFTRPYDGYISLGPLTARIKGREISLSTKSLADGEYIPHLVLKDKTLDLPRVRKAGGEISPSGVEDSQLGRLAVRQKMLTRRIEAIEERLDEISEKVYGRGLFIAVEERKE